VIRSPRKPCIPRRPAPGRGAPGPACPVTLAALLTVLLLAGPARAAPRTGELQAEVAVRQGRVTARLDLSPAVDDPLLRRLGNGLTNVITVVVVVRPAGGGPVLAAGARVVEVLYDVWDEAYALTVRDQASPTVRRLTVRDPAALPALLAGQEPVDLGAAEALGAGPLELEVRVEVNPVSRELMQRTRELLAHPGSGGRPGSGTSSVIGAVAGYLLRDPGPGDDLVLLRSRALPWPGSTAP